MKVKTKFQITRLPGMNDWAVLITPAIFVARKDVFSDEGALWVGFHWLLFRFTVLFISKK